MSATKFLLLVLFLCSGVAFAQSVDKDPRAIVEFGGAAGRSLKDGGSSFGADAAIEFTPIENWLELEAGVTPLFSIIRRNGIPTSCLRSHGRFPKKRS